MIKRVTKKDVKKIIKTNKAVKAKAIDPKSVKAELTPSMVDPKGSMEDVSFGVDMQQFAEIEEEAEREARKWRIIGLIGLALILGLAYLNWGWPSFN